MKFSIRLLTVSLLLNTAVANHAIANTVFANKNKSTHELPGAEQQGIRAEFDKKFASKGVSAKVTSKDPWKAKEQRQQMGDQERSATWGECRESALKNRFGCYRERKQPYHCELFYEARIKLCDENL
ncbi:MAG: hypothetical protein OQK76_05630 [Gammaproteobacteria bacterium]|nr:hypothetical protein [Gammaproteobacteria bacterium]MCW8910085.1 hypothetical protein [Gammaproteobacteria bacterium]MCW9005270.1 hypothetical protein [Gammaproteobacteria bacterium]MCW9057234.1 hypothetical protein [Gammaproteobacteria bacterium]